LYIQVASVLRTRIQSGQWSAGEKISTLEELEQEFEVARVTVRQAIDILREEGMLQARQGLGTFVSKRNYDRHWVTLATNWNSLIESLQDNVPRRLAIDHDVAPPNLTDGDGNPASSYVKLRSVQYRNEEPYSVVNLHLARELYDLNPERFKSAAALVTIDAMEEVTPLEAHQTLTIGSAEPEIADLLKISIGAPTVEAHCVVVDDRGIAIYVGDIIYRSESIKLQMNLLATTPLRQKKARNGFKAIGLSRGKSRKV
jgi:GntR family transcriptional regulator